VALPAFARRTPLLLRAGQQLNDISCTPGPQQQTCSSGFAAVGFTGTDRQTDTVPSVTRTLLRMLCGQCQ